MDSKGFFDLNKLIKLQEIRYSKSTHYNQNNFQYKESNLDTYGENSSIDNDILNLNDKLSDIRDILDNERIKDYNDHIDLNQNTKESLIDEDEIKFLFRRYNSIENEKLKEEIDKLFEDILKCEKTIEHIELFISKNHGHINTSEYVIQLEVERSLKKVLRNKLESEVNGLLDNIQERSKIAKNIYHMLKQIESMKK